MNQQIYISYNWKEDSNEMANQLVQAFAAKGIEIIRDKTHTSYKDSIKNFMQQIGQGKCVIADDGDDTFPLSNLLHKVFDGVFIGGVGFIPNNLNSFCFKCLDELIWDYSG